MKAIPPMVRRNWRWTRCCAGCVIPVTTSSAKVVENEFSDEVPEEKQEAFILKLMPLVGNVFSVYDLSDDNFALSSDYDLLYTELTGATVLYLDEYGV